MHKVTIARRAVSIAAQLTVQATEVLKLGATDEAWRIFNMVKEINEIATRLTPVLPTVAAARVETAEPEMDIESELSHVLRL